MVQKIPVTIKTAFTYARKSDYPVGDYFFRMNKHFLCDREVGGEFIVFGITI